MKSLVFTIAFCLAISATAAVPEAQEVADGSYYHGGGVTLQMDVGFTTNPDVVTVQAVSASGWSNTVYGSAGENHSDEHATCEDSGVMTVPTETGTMQVKCENGRVKRKVGDRWVPMNKNWRMSNQIGRGTGTNGPGEEVVTLPFDAAGAEISFEEYRSLMGYSVDQSRSARRN